MAMRVSSATAASLLQVLFAAAATFLLAFAPESGAYPSYYDCSSSAFWTSGAPFGHMNAPSFANAGAESVAQKHNPSCSVTVNGKPASELDVVVDPGSVVDITVSGDPSFLYGVSASVPTSPSSPTEGTQQPLQGTFVGSNPKKAPTATCSYAYNDLPAVAKVDFQLMAPQLNATSKCRAVGIRAACGDYSNMVAGRQVILLVGGSSVSDAKSCDGYGELSVAPAAFLEPQAAAAALASTEGGAAAALSSGESQTTDRRVQAVLAHGFLMLIAFGLLFPLGAATSLAKPKAKQVPTASGGGGGGPANDDEEGGGGGGGGKPRVKEDGGREGGEEGRVGDVVAGETTVGPLTALYLWLRSEGVWFKFHLALQISAAAAAAGGFIASFYTQVVAWTFMEADDHPIIGCFLIAAVGSQVILGFVRPHKNSKSSGGNNGKSEGSFGLRLVWEWVHKVLGWLIVLLGIGNCCIGIDIAASAFRYEPYVPAFIATLCSFSVPTLLVIALEAFGAWEQMHHKAT